MTDETPHSEEPFRSRPKVERRPPPPEPETEYDPPPSSALPRIEDNEDIIEGVIEEDLPQSMIVAEPQPHDPIQLPEDQEEEPAKQSKRRWKLDYGLLLIALGLVVGGIFVTFLNTTSLPESLERNYPIAIIVVALLWSIVALLRRNVRAFIGGAVVTGLSLSLLLQTQDIANFGETAIGILLMTFGVSIVMRGLLLRQVQPS